MKVLGVAKGRTSTGKTLRQGGTALICNGQVIAALAEERVTREKHAGGFDASLQEVLSATRTRLDDVDLIAVSTCCEPECEALSGHSLAGHPRLVSVNHHLSHAALAFYGSGFRRALVLVADGGGNVLSGGPVDDRWWLRRREQLSYYVGTVAGGLQLVGRDFDEPEAVGLGELYRAFTYFLGWPSSRYASRVMALSAHGRRRQFYADVYQLIDGRLRSPLRNDPPHPIEMVRALAEHFSLEFGEPRSPGEELLQRHADIAAFVQFILEEALIRKLRWLKSEVEFDHLCLSGGLALNVVANGRIAREGISERIYVPPAPADDGQALGNAMLAHSLASPKPSIRPITCSHQAAVGPEVKVDSAVVGDALHASCCPHWTVFENPNLPKTVASFLSAGWPIVVFNGRSEFGPRALGHRSILADPRRSDLATELNRVKDRASFMPFAPAVLQERAEEWLDGWHVSPFMSFAVPIHDRLRRRIPGVVHRDGSARVQTVHHDDSTLLRRVLEEFYISTGIPLLLNTSFNRGGEPIVETVDDAIHAFSDMAIDVMVLGRFVVVKTLAAELAAMGLLPQCYSVATTAIVKDGVTCPLAVRGMLASDVIRSVQEATGSVVFVRHDFPLYGTYLEWLRQGRRMVTVRFRRGGVEVPRDRDLPLFRTHDYGVDRGQSPDAHVHIRSVRYQRWADFTDDSAVRDGFKSLDQMLGDFRRICPHVQSEDWVTLYEVELVDD